MSDTRDHPEEGVPGTPSTPGTPPSSTPKPPPIDQQPIEPNPGTPGQDLPPVDPNSPGQDLPPESPGSPDQGFNPDAPDQGFNPGSPDQGFNPDSPGQGLPPVDPESPDQSLPEQPADEDHRHPLLVHLAAHKLKERGEHKRRPNILVIFGDDIGMWNLSAYNQGMMGYQTPNLDRIANEGILFTDAYADQSCTAGRSSFITGQNTLRTGMSKVGLPGEAFGISDKHPTIGHVLRDQGYAVAQFGKNHLGDRDEHLPTVHGFDEFFGNLYHLNAEEEPEDPEFPLNPHYPRPRGVLHCKALRDGPRGGERQSIEDTGPLDIKRMETIDEEFLEAASDFIRDHERGVGSQEGGQPWLCWFNTSRMHIWTHLKAESQKVTGLGVYADGMTEHDGHVGQLLDLLDELKCADDTIVIYTTDNGAEVFSWPDGGTAPFRGEKNSTYEGGYRVPMVMRWPMHFPAGVKRNDIISLLDFLPTLAAAAGNDHLTEDLLKGAKIDGEQWDPAHLDGYNLLYHLNETPVNVPSVVGKAPAKRAGRHGEWPRHEFFYLSDKGELVAIRWDQYKVLLVEQKATGFETWIGPHDTLRIPRIHNLRSDPFEKNIETSGFPEHQIRKFYLFAGFGELGGKFVETLEHYPPRTELMQEDLRSQGPAAMRSAASQFVMTFKGSRRQVSEALSPLMTAPD